MFVWRYGNNVVPLPSETTKATIINRGSRKMYAIIPIDDGDLTITPALEAKIEKARQEYRDGQTLHFENAAAAQKSAVVTLLSRNKQT